MRQLPHTVLILALAAFVTACDAREERAAATADPNAPRPVATAAPEPDAADAAPAAPAEPFVLVVFGDSLSAGYGLPPAAALPAQLALFLDADGAHLDVRNAGVSGDTSTTALARFDWSVVPEADGVLIELGSNDMLQGAPVEALEANIAAAIERAQARGLWVGLVGMKAPLNADPDYRAAFDAVFPDLADAYGVELYSYYFDGLIDPETGDSRPELFLPDGVHPTDAGVTIVAEGMADWLEDVLPRDALGR